MKFEELQKALDEVEAIVWATCEFDSLGRQKMNVLINLFSSFKAEYDGQVHVSRKQLSDLMKRQPLPEAFRWISDFKSQYEHWTRKMKELLSASEVTCESCLFLGCNEGVCLNCGTKKHHWLPKASDGGKTRFYTVAEAREKLKVKDASKETKK